MIYITYIICIIHIIYTTQTVKLILKHINKIIKYYFIHLVKPEYELRVATCKLRVTSYELKA